MKINLITYSDEKYKKYQTQLIEQAKNIFDGVYAFTDKWLKKTDFYLENKIILDQKRGAGYFLWKPYVILETFKYIDYGDIVLYIDSADTFTDNIISFLRYYFDKQENNIILTQGAYPQKEWTKKDCFTFMNCDTSEYHNIIQIEAGILCFRKNKENTKLIEEWLGYCKNENIITDIPNVTGENYEGFKDHRHDQSILTNLAVRYNITSNSLLRPFITCNVY